jgi:hypothetical protein
VTSYFIINSLFKGYTGKNCKTAIDYCTSNPCLNNGNCTSLIGMFACNCPVEYVGQTCNIYQKKCTNNPCINGGLCSENGIGGYNCYCLNGWSGLNCEININYCSSSPCKNSKANILNLLNSTIYF